MSRLLTRGERIRVVQYRLFFQNVAHPDSGYSFDCDESGALLEGRTLESLHTTHPEIFTAAFRKPYVETYRHSYWQPATMRCGCDKVISLPDPLSNDCDCGRCYNSSGQQVEANYGRAECIRDGWAYDENDY